MNTRFSVIAGLFLLVLSACESKKINKDNTSLSIPKLACNVCYPKHWTCAVTGKDSNQYSFLAGLNDSNATFSTRISLWNEKIPFAMNPNDYHQGVITLIKLSNRGLQILPLPNDSTENKNFRGYTFDFTPDEGSRYTVFGYTIMHDSLAYNITMTCEADKAKPYHDTLKQFLHNIEFK